MIALVIQLYDENKEKVFIATLDKGLLKALKPFSNEIEYYVLEKTLISQKTLTGRRECLVKKPLQKPL